MNEFEFFIARTMISENTSIIPNLSSRMWASELRTRRRVERGGNSQANHSSQGWLGFVIKQRHSANSCRSTSHNDPLNQLIEARDVSLFMSQFLFFSMHSRVRELNLIKDFFSSKLGYGEHIIGQPVAMASIIFIDDNKSKSNKFQLIRKLFIAGSFYDASHEAPPTQKLRFSLYRTKTNFQRGRITARSIFHVFVALYPWSPSLFVDE